MAFFCQASIHFPEALLIDCLFHWIKAMWKIGVKLGISKNELTFAMHETELIKVLPKEDLHPRGTTYVDGNVLNFLCKLYGKDTDEFQKDEFEA